MPKKLYASKKRKSVTSGAGGSKYGKTAKYKSGSRSRFVARSGAKQLVRAIVKNQKNDLNRIDTQIVTFPAAVTALTNTNASLSNVNSIRQGTGDFERLGRKIEMQRLDLTVLAEAVIAASLNTTTDSINNGLRVCVVYDKQPDGSVPSYDKIFAIESAIGTVTSQFLASRFPPNMDRFEVLLDDHWIFNQYVGFTTVSPTIRAFQTRKYVVDLKGRETTYSGTATFPGIAEIQTGALYVIILAMSNSTTCFMETTASTHARLTYRP